jgi:hypothetical protein
MRQVTGSLKGPGSRESDQGAVWSLIDEKSARLSTASDTSAMSALFEKQETPLEEFVAEFSPSEHQVGAMFFINGVQAGLELFDAASTWRKLAPKLVRSYAVDAIDRRGKPSRARARRTPQAFANAVGSTPTSVFPAIGEGSDVRLTGTDVAGAALVAGGRVIHLSAFPAADRLA